MSEQYITESYLRRQIEEKAFSDVGVILSDLCFTGFHLYTNLDYWSEDSIVDLARDNARYFRFTVKDRFYRPGGTVNRSPPKGVDDSTGTTGQYTPIRNGGNTPIEHQVTDTVTLEHNQTSTLSKGIELDLTSKVSAGYGGVSAELESHLGITVNTEESESTTETKSHTFSDTVEVGPGDEIAVVYTRGSKRYTQDFVIDALADCSFYLKISEWDGSKYAGPDAPILSSKHNRGLWDYQSSPHWGAHWESLHDFCGFVRGYDVRAPNMHYYFKNASPKAKAALTVLEDASILGLKLDGSDSIISQGDPAFSVVDISNLSDGDVRDRYGHEGQPLGDTLPLVETRVYYDETKGRNLADFPHTEPFTGERYYKLMKIVRD